MSLSTFSVFYYGYEIDESNNTINFDEGSGELSAIIDTGSYTATGILTAIKTAMDAVGSNTYTIALDRDTRKITISSGSNFDLLVNSGTAVGTSPWTELGFTGGADRAGASSYEGAGASGSSYEPQFILQNYVDPNQNRELVDASINESAAGIITTVGFGSRSFIEMNITFINNYGESAWFLKANTSGKSDAEDFLTHCTQKRPLEFMPDIDDRSTFYKVILESTPSSGKGIGFKLRELTGRGLPGYYETGTLKFRVVS